jgi:hypothetical protein
VITSLKEFKNTVNPDVNKDQDKGFIGAHLALRKDVIKMLLHKRDTDQIIPSTITTHGEPLVKNLKAFKLAKGIKFSTDYPKYSVSSI